MHVVRAVFSSSAHAETRAEEAAVRGELLRRRQGMVRSSSATSDPRLTPKATAAAASALLEAGLETSRLGGAAEGVIRASVSLARNRRLRTLGGGLGDESVGYGWAATRKNPESALGLMGCRVRSTLPHPHTPAAAKEAIRCSGARWNPNGGERMKFSGHLNTMPAEREHDCTDTQRARRLLRPKHPSHTSRCCTRTPRSTTCC